MVFDSRLYVVLQRVVEFQVRHCCLITSGSYRPAIEVVTFGYVQLTSEISGIY